MSTVVYDGKILAADRQMTSNCTIKICHKIFKEKNYIMSFVGGLAQGLHLCEWYRKGAKVKDYPIFQLDKEDFTTLIVAKKKEVVYYQDLPIPVKVHDSFAAWGSGSDFAMGAMAFGANAIEAVEIASKFDIYTGQGIDHFIIK